MANTVPRDRPNQSLVHQEKDAQLTIYQHLIVTAPQDTTAFRVLEMPMVLIVLLAISALLEPIDRFLAQPELISQTRGRQH
jgi:hypothetical protein